MPDSKTPSELAPQKHALTTSSVPFGARQARALLLALTITSLMAGATWAGSWEKGNAALEKGKPEKAARLFKRAARDGDSRAQYSLAILYLQGKGVEQDDEQGVKWLRKAAKQGLAVSQSLLGSLYSSGKVIAQDDAKAVEWYRAAADQGDHKGQVSLAIMLHGGRGVARDDTEAYMWLLVSEWNSGPSTRAQRDFLATDLRPDEITDAERRAAKWKPKRKSRSSSGPSDAPNIGGGY
jgi:TPR repeat protein